MNKDGESISDTYARLTALRVKIKGLGSDNFNDGFTVNDEFIKSKIIAMIATEDTKLALNVQLLDKTNSFSPDDLVSYLCATERMASDGLKVKEIN